MDQTILDKKLNKLYEIETEIKLLKLKEAKLKEELLPVIQEAKKAKFYDMNITYVAGVDRSSFDKKAFELANPKLDLTPYNKITKTKDSLRVSFEKVKEENKNE